jgi:hypothetical protein
MVLAGGILSAALLASISPQTSLATTTYQANFGRPEDADNDGWPDGWRRRIDRDHPRFVKIGVTSRSELSSEELQQARRSLAQWSLAWQQQRWPGDIIPESVPPAIDQFLEATVADTCLEIQMNGGAAQVESPSFPIDPQSSYRVSAEWMLDLIDAYRVHLSVVWLAPDETTVGESAIAHQEASSNWQPLVLAETSSIPATARFAKIRWRVQPLASRSIQATLRLDRVRVERIPKIEILVQPPSRLVQAGKTFHVDCQLHELDTEVSEVQLSAIDHEGKVGWRVSAPIAIDDPNKRLSFEWNLALPLPGHYHLQAELKGGSSRNRRHATLVVLPELPRGPTGGNSRIGWSLPGLGKTLPPDLLLQLLDIAQPGGVKFSVWLADTNVGDSLTLGRLVEKLVAKGVQCVGVLDIPSPELQKKFPDAHGRSIATLLDYPAIWEPMLEAIWRKVSLYLFQYQLGWDKESAFQTHDRWRENVEAVAKHMRLSGVEARLTMPWNALEAAPEVSQLPSVKTIDRWNWFAEPGLTSDELESFSRSQTNQPSEAWLTLEPLDRSRYSLSDRVRDLAQRLVSVHQYQWKTAWITDPQAPVAGILEPDGGPRELLLPLIHLTRFLNQSEDFIPVRLDARMVGTMFRVGEEDRMLLIADRPQEVGVYLGDRWSATDIWGRPVASTERPVSGVPTTFLATGPWPILVYDVDRLLVQWQQQVVIENPTIENRVGLSEPVRVRLANPDDHDVHGTIELVAPKLLQEERSQSPFHLPLQRPETVEIPMKLRFDAGQNEESVDLVVQVDDKPYRRFVVHRELVVGLKDFRMETHTKNDTNGWLIVDIELMNLGGEPANFDCSLVIPGRRREKFQLLRVSDRVTRRIAVANGRQLIGQTLLLRCEEIGSGRIINHRIPIEE